MPQLSDLIEKKKFVKKSYRPWDLSGTGTIDGKDKPVIEPGPLVEEINSVASSFENEVPISTDKNTPDQTANKQDNIQVTNKEHTDNNKVTAKTRLDNKETTTRQQVSNVTDNITDNTINVRYLVDAIKKLTGIQKNIFLYIINLCSARGMLDTGNILSADIAYTANCSIGSAKTSLIRLIEKSLILRLEGKACRGGHLVLGITKEIQSAAIQAQQALFNPLKTPHLDNTMGNIINNTNLYSSSNKNFITTTLSDEWKKINFENLKKIGFSETQIKQLADTNATTPEIVQESINHFSFSLDNKNNVKAYSDPLNVLMGVLRKGQKWSEPGYISPKELAMKQILEEKKKQKERFDAMVNEFLELEFPEWKKKISNDEIKKIVPAEVLKTNISGAIQSSLRNYYIEKILLPRLDGK